MKIVPSVNSNRHNKVYPSLSKSMIVNVVFKSWKLLEASFTFAGELVVKIIKEAKNCDVVAEIGDHLSVHYVGRF